MFFDEHIRKLTHLQIDFYLYLAAVNRNQTNFHRRPLVKFMKAFLIPTLLLCGSLLLFNGCSEGLFNQKLKEGIIEYKAEPVNAKESMAMWAPDNMEVKFKDDKWTVNLEAGMGAMRMDFISDPGKKQFISLISFLGKFYSIMEGAELDTTNKYLPDYDVTYPGEKKIIAGYDCEKAVLNFKDGSPAMEVWFTKEIQIKDPNWSNCYYKVDGVLMDYNLRKFGLELHFTATSVSEATIDDSVFEIPDDYKQKPNAELDQMMSGFF